MTSQKSRCKILGFHFRNEKAVRSPESPMSGGFPPVAKLPQSIRRRHPAKRKGTTRSPPRHERQQASDDAFRRPEDVAPCLGLWENRARGRPIRRTWSPKARESAIRLFRPSDDRRCPCRSPCPLNPKIGRRFARSPPAAGDRFQLMRHEGLLGQQHDRSIPVALEPHVQRDTGEGADQAPLRLLLALSPGGALHGWAGPGVPLSGFYGIPKIPFSEINPFSISEFHAFSASSPSSMSFVALMKDQRCPG